MPGHPCPTMAAFPAKPVFNMSLPEYRSRYLPAMTLEQITSIPQREDALVIIPTGAIEQHGPQLPVGVDALMGQAWLNVAMPHIPDSAGVYVAPPITMGKSNEHAGFPGTLFIPAKVLRRLILAIFQTCYDWGFRRFAFLNTHGGNTSVVKIAMTEMEAVDPAVETIFLRSGWDAPISEQEAVYGFHAGEVETSWMLAAVEDAGIIDTTVLPCEFPGSVDSDDELRAECAPATYSWITADVSASGVIGDSSKATIEKGKIWLEASGKSLAEVILSHCR